MAECERRTPDEVEISTAPRQPVTDSTLGVAVPTAADEPAPGHRFVTVGDSLTHGYMSGAIFRTDLSWPAMVAYELGMGTTSFRFPRYEESDGPGGLPLDLERLARALETKFGEKIDFREVVRAGLFVRSYMDAIEDYWERGPGSTPPQATQSYDNLAVYGWDVLDAILLDAPTADRRIAAPKDDLVKQLVSNDGDRAARVVLAPLGTQTVLGAAAAMGRSEGIETLVVVLGANNALGSVVALQPCWTDDAYGDLSPRRRLNVKGNFNVWRPSHFAQEWTLLVEQVRRVPARHVVFATIPSVTISPIARGVGGKIQPGSRYFPYYTRAWISDEDFDPVRDPHLTADEARAIDSAIDAYNRTIIDSVAAARQDGFDWHLFDMAAHLDRLATRRYIESPWARPAWWTPYELPAQLRALDPVPNTRFFRAGPQGRTDGGLFSLDGVHPTTIGYGLIAQEVIRIMEGAGVVFNGRDGAARTSPIVVDWDRILATDTLITDPPASISSSLSLLGWLDDRLDWVSGALPFGRR